MKPIRYISLITASTLFYAATPDAGQQMKQIEQDIAKKEKSGIQKPLTAPKKQAAPDINSAGFKTMVTSFEITGMTSFDAKSVISSVLTEFVGKELTLSDIRKAADAIQDYYANKGLIAKVSIPAQSIKNGIVKLVVVEGKAGEIIIEDANATRMKSEKLKEYLYHSQPKGSIITMDNLQKGLYILNELPGLSVASSLLPGATEGSTDIIVNAKDTARTDGMLFLDNFGSRFTGMVQGTAIASVNDVSGKGLYDQLSARILKTQGSNYGRVAYMLPTGTSGLKLGVNGSKMDYKINSLSVAEGYNGASDDIGISADYPIVRTKSQNLSASLAFDSKHYKDRDSSNSVLTTKKVRVANASITGDSSDDYLTGGQNNYSLTVSKGNLITSSTSALSAGGYMKVSITASRLQRIDDNWQLFAQATVQKSNKNLDSSEKMTIGGNSGVRAYPTGEASADEGFVGSLEARRSLGNGWQAVCFYDYGFAHINYTATDTNAYSLSGIGAGVSWSGNSVVSKLQVSKPIGSNEGRDATTGNDSDGLKPQARVWASVQYKF